MKTMDKQEIANTVNRYGDRYRQFGYSPKTLGWTKGKQDIRFDVLTSQYDCTGKNVLDIGCGFGDLNKTLAEKFGTYGYVGCDLCEELIAEGRTRYPRAHFVTGDILALELSMNIDWAVASGPFNHIFRRGNNYAFIESVMKKTFALVADGFSFDFISDKVDYKESHIFYASPEKILSYAYTLSRNIVLRSDYMPFEFSLFVFQDDSFDKDDTVFRKYKKV